MNTQFSFKERFVSGETQYGFWNVVSKVAGFANTVFILSSVSLYQYGVFQLLLALYGFFSDALSIGGGVVNNDISRHIGSGEESRAKKLFNEYAKVRIFAGAALFIAFFFGAELFAERYSVEFVREIRIISFLFLTEVAFTTMRSLIQIRLHFGPAASRSAIYKIIQLVILVYFFATSSVGLKQLLLSMVIGSAVSLLFLVKPFWLSYKKWSAVPSADETMLWRVFSTYGKWEILSQIGSKITSRVKPWLIKFFISTEAVAIFTVAHSAVGALKDSLPFKTLHNLIPLKIHDKEASQRIFTFGVKYMAALAVLYALAGAALVPVAISLLFPQYLPSVPLFLLMITAFPVVAASIVIIYFLVALRHQKFLFLHGTLRNILGLLFYAGLLPFVGIWGLAWERVVTPVIVLAVSLWYIQHYSVVRLEYRKIFSFRTEDKNFSKEIISLFLDRLKKKIKR